MAEAETTVGLEEAAAFLRADRAWVILKSDLVSYLRGEVKKQTSERRSCISAPTNRRGRPRKALPELKG